MSDWMYVQENPSEQLAQLHFFSVLKRQQGSEISFQITVKEFATPPPGQHVPFLRRS